MGKQARLRAARRPTVVKAYVDAAREILPTIFRPDSCVNGTRVCIEALKLHGVNARPLAVDMIVANDKATEMFNANGGDWPREDEEVRRWMAEGAWVLQIDGRDNGLKTSSGDDGWPHHLVAMTDELLIDSSLGQASRPAKNIELPWCAVFPRGPFTISTMTITYDAPGGVIVGFMARPDVTDYVRLSGFQRSRHNMEAAHTIAERMGELLKDEDNA